MLEVVAAGVFAAWLVATAATGVEGTRVARAVRRFDVPGLVPGWSFFAPDPGTSDYQVLVRCRRPDGATGPFVEVAEPSSTLRRSVWHPQKRLRKTIFDCAQELMTLDDRETSAAEYTQAYLTLLSLAISRAGPDRGSVQFLVVRSGSHEPRPKLLLRSRFHPVSR